MVSVIVPSFKRANLLRKTLPTYIQGNVTELILVDDCSPDDTAQVVESIIKDYPMIRYFRNPNNLRQPASKNVGIDKAVGDYIYFGDDDSILLPDSIDCLVETMEKYSCDAVMARPIVAGSDYRDDKREEYLKWRLKRNGVNDVKDIVDIQHLRFNFGKYIKTLQPIQVPTCHAGALVKTELARTCRFDPNFKGCAYREETDFFFRLNLDHNAKLMYDARAVQMNLPDYMVKNTGAREGGYSTWRQSAVECNLYFLRKNWKKICAKYGIERSIEEMQAEFENSLPMQAPKTNPLKAMLKQLYFQLFVYKNKCSPIRSLVRSKW